jgi:hypothetical protein
VCVGSAESRACSQTASNESANNSPTGATRMAAPLPNEPPGNRLAATAA